jgi:hypothetical protein
VTKPTAQEWQETVRPHFGFLIPYGFDGPNVEEEEWWETAVAYRSDAAAIRVVFSVEFRHVEVELIRLVDGQTPGVPVFVTGQPELDRFWLDTLVEVRAPDRVKKLRRLRGLKPSRVAQQLSAWASALKELGTDFLSGDFSSFPLMDAVIRERVRRTPERVQVYLPESATAEEEEGERKRLKGVFPEVPVISARYGSWRRRRK